MSKVDRPCLGLVLLGPMAVYKEGNFTFCEKTINEECIYQTNESYFILTGWRK